MQFIRHSIICIILTTICYLPTIKADPQNGLAIAQEMMPAKKVLAIMRLIWK